MERKQKAWHWQIKREVAGPQPEHHHLELAMLAVMDVEAPPAQSDSAVDCAQVTALFHRKLSDKKAGLFRQGLHGGNWAAQNYPRHMREHPATCIRASCLANAQTTL